MKWLLGCGILMALASILLVVAAGLEGLSWSRLAQGGWPRSGSLVVMGGLVGCWGVAG